MSQLLRICCAVGGNICLWDYKENTREFVATPCYSITRFCGNASQGLVAFSEGGTSPKVYYTVTFNNDDEVNQLTP